MAYGDANRLISYNGTSISYDADGNMLSTPLEDKWVALTYSSENILTDVVTSDGAIAAYVYDAEGNRIGKTENGVTTTYVVDTNSALSQVLMSTENGETTYYVYGLGLISQENSDGYKLYHYDYRGSTTTITNLNGEVTDTLYYDPYGNIISRTGTTDTSFLYVGQYGVETDESGLYYMRARYYNPQIQRFINVDPIRAGYNWYGYVDGNPSNCIDPIGKSGYAQGIMEVWGAAALISQADSPLPGPADAVAVALGIVGTGAVIYNEINNTNAKARTDKSISITIPDIEPNIESSDTDNLNKNILSKMGLVTLIGTYLYDKYVEEDIREKSISYVNAAIKQNIEHRDYSVYVFYDIDRKVHYVGRTNDFNRRKSEHQPRLDRNGYDMKIIMTDLTKQESRGVEQIFISVYTIEALDNMRREIAKSRLNSAAKEGARVLSIIESLPENDYLEFMMR